METRPDHNWVRSTEFTAPSGRIVRPGTEVSIIGVSGRFRFQEHVLNPSNGAEWISVCGGRKDERSLRCFAPERIKRVHYKEKLR